MNHKLLSGKVVGGCKLQNIIGSGGMGVIYLAEQLRLGRLVAVKLLSFRNAENKKEAIKRFQREAHLAAKIQHSNVIQIYDVGQQEDDIHYIVMQYVEGFDLNTVLQQGQKFYAEKCLHIAKEVTKALVAAHEQNIIHRDIKPANIMMQNDGGIFVTDFGLAKLPMSNSTESGVPLGTLTYMAPEQVKASVDLDYRADIYSLGATLYHLLTGQPPFTATSMVELMYKCVNADIPKINTIRSDVPPAVTELIDKMMARSRDERYQTAQELLDKIVSILSRSKGTQLQISPIGVVKKAKTLVPTLLEGERELGQNVRVLLKLEEDEFTCANPECSAKYNIMDIKRSSAIFFIGQIWCPHCLWATFQHRLLDMRVAKTEERSFGDYWISLKQSQRFDVQQPPMVLCSYPLQRDKKGWENMLLRVKRGAELISKIRHNNILNTSICREVEEKNIAYTTMNYIPGVWLSQVIDYVHSQNKRLSLIESFAILRQLTKAISCIHSHNIIHRNITPGSIHLSLSGAIRLGNFNMAKRLFPDIEGATITIDDKNPIKFQEYCPEYWTGEQEKPDINPSGNITTNLKTVLGTLSYMSPEQTMGIDNIDLRTDLWSWGVIAYELFMGKRLFPKQNSWAIVQLIRSGKIPPLTANVPVTMQKIIYKALSRNANKRYQTGGEILEDLEAVCESFG